MKILPTSVKSFFNQVFNPPSNKLLKAVYEWQINNGIATPLNDNPDAYLKQGYMGNADVYAIINRIIRMSNQARLALYTKEKGKWVEITDHELCAFIDMANPTMKMSEFSQGHLIYKLSIGNAYWYKPIIDVGVNKGKTKELWLLPSNNVRITGGANWMNPVGGYILEGNQQVTFSTDEVYHSKYFNPMFGTESTLYGVSPLKAAARVVSKQNSAETTEMKQFTNQSPPYLLFKDTNDAFSGLSTEQKSQVESQFENYASKYKTGQPIVLTDKFGMIRLGVSPVDLGILQSSQEGRRVLCSIYGMPSELFNDKSASTYNNVIEVKRDAWNNCIKPNMDEFASDLTRFLISGIDAYKGLFFAYDYSQVAELQADIAKSVVWMRQAYWTPNEIREATGANVIDNPTMDEPWVSMAESPISQATATEELTPAELKNFGDYR